MKQGGGNSFGAVVIALILSGFLAYISSANGQRDLQSILLSIRQSAMQVPVCQSLPTDATPTGVPLPAVD